LRTLRWLLVFPSSMAIAAGCGLDAIPSAPSEPSATPADAGDASSDANEEGGPRDAGGDSHDATQAGDVYVPPLGDGSAPPADAETDGESGAVDGGVPTGATLLQTGLGTYYTTTKDGYVVYDLQGADGGFTLMASPLDGGPPVTIVSDEDPTNGGGIGATGTPTILFWDQCVSETSICRLITWSAATGTHTTSQSLACIGAASPDGSEVVYLDSPNAVGTTATVVGNGVALSPATRQVFEPGVGIGLAPTVPGDTCSGYGSPLSDTCPLEVAFAGQQALVSYCLPGLVNSTIDSFPAPYGSAQRVNLATDALGGVWSTDQAGDLLFTDTQTGALCGGVMTPIGTGTAGCVVETATGAPAPVDVLLAQGNATAGALTADGTNLYVIGNLTDQHQVFSGLLRIDLASSAFTQLTSSVDRILSVTDNTVVFDTRALNEAGIGTNLFALTTAGGNLDFEELSTQTNAYLQGLTTDGNQIVFMTVSNDPLSMNETFTLAAAPVTGAPPRVLYTGPLTGVASPSPPATTMADGERVLFLDSSFDLELVDLASSAPPRILVPGPLSAFAVDPSLTTLIFVAAGNLYSLPLP
jgi:hypothetical protein